MISTIVKPLSAPTKAQPRTMTRVIWKLPTLRAAFVSDLGLTQCVLQWLAELALVAYLAQALIARTDLLTNATSATHDCHSLDKM